MHNWKQSVIILGLAGFCAFPLGCSKPAEETTVTKAVTETVTEAAAESVIEEAAESAEESVYKGTVISDKDISDHSISDEDILDNDSSESDSVKDYFVLYTEFLQTLKKESTEEESFRFDIGDPSGDNLPELFLIHNNAEEPEIMIYTVKENKVSAIDSAETDEMKLQQISYESAFEIEHFTVKQLVDFYGQSPDALSESAGIDYRKAYQLLGSSTQVRTENGWTIGETMPIYFLAMEIEIGEHRYVVMEVDPHPDQSVSEKELNHNGARAYAVNPDTKEIYKLDPHTDETVLITD